MGIDPAHAQLAFGAAIEFGAAAEADALRVFGALDLPGMAGAQPVVRLLDLLAVDDLLPEHAVLVTDAVALHRQLQRGAAVEKTGGQPPQAAVAEAGVVFGLGQLFQLQAEPVRAWRIASVDAEVEHGIAQGAPHEKFQGEIIAALAVALVVGVAGIFPALHQTVAQDQGQGLVGVVDRAAVLVAPEIMRVIAAEIPRQAVRVHPEGGQFGQIGVGEVMKKLIAKIHGVSFSQGMAA